MLQFYREATKIIERPFKTIDCSSNILCVQWKPIKVRADKNKFVIYTAEANIVELTFYERTYSCIAVSPKGEICISL